MKIGNAEDAKVVAAAIISLHIGEDRPIAVEANDVKASRKDQNWVCKAVHDGCFFDVVFDRDGKYVSMSTVSRVKSDGNDRHGKRTSKPVGVGKAKRMYYTANTFANGATVVIVHNTPQGDVKCDEIPANTMAKAAGVATRKVAGGVVLVFHRNGKITSVEWEHKPIPASPDAVPESKDSLKE